MKAKRLALPEFYNALVALPFLPLLVSIISGNRGLLSPPLGPIEPGAFVLVIISGVASSYCVFRVGRWQSTGCILACIAAVLFGFSYLAASHRFVRTLPIPSQKTSAVVSVGYDRTDFARSLGDVDDVGLLRLRGTDEEEIEKLWTPNSILVGRLLLALTYTLTVTSFAALFSFIVLENKMHPSRRLPL